MFTKTIFSLLVGLMIIEVKSHKVLYLNALDENESCKLNDQTYGNCKKISECNEEFSKFRKNQTVLKICKFDNNQQNTLICCPKNLDFKPILLTKKMKNIDFTDYETCQKKYLNYREKSLNYKAYINLILSLKQPVSKELCDQVNDIVSQTSELFEGFLEIPETDDFSDLAPLMD